MQKFISALRGIGSRVMTLIRPLQRRFNALPRWGKIVAAVVLIIVVIGGFAILRGSDKSTTTENLRSVTLRSVAELSGNGSAGSVLGTVRARAEATILTETAGTVERVNTTLGARVPAGFILIELENASERAAVLQAEGAYDSAVAARASVSPVDDDASARNVYRTTFSSIDTMIENDVDLFFGAQTPVGPDLLINPANGDSETLSRQRTEIDHMMDSWREALSSAGTRDPELLLEEAESNVREVESFVEDIAIAANRSNSRATTAQIAALASARAEIQATLSLITNERTSYRRGSTGSTASVDAGVKSALGTLRFAQANLEKTRVRAPIAGTVNFLPAMVGDYLTGFTHAATVAENSALEIVGYVSEDDRATLTVGTTVTIEESFAGLVTSISPALDPVAKQIEVHIALTGENDLVNGQSVRVLLPNAPTETVSGPLYLPLASVKLRADDRVVFSVNAEGRLEATVVDIGMVRGDSIEILTPLDSALRIVSDARGLAEGERVNVAP